MKAIKLSWLVILLPLFILCSCSSDDSATSVKSSLIGVWETSMQSSNWKTIAIHPNGKLKYDYLTKSQLVQYTYNSEKGTYCYQWTDKNGIIYGVEYDPNDNAYWAFDENTQTISMYTESGYYSYSFKVTMNDDKNSWLGTDAKGRTYTFKRIKE